MKTFKKRALAIAVAICSLTVGAAAQAAECQLRNISFVSTVNDGRLVVNSEMWTFNGSAWVQSGSLANSTYCSVNTTLGGVTPNACKNWYQLALAAMLANKKIYVTANACLTGNGVNMSGIGYFGLNH